MFSHVLNGIRHYRRVNVVVMLAVAIATTVISGSLIIGDSIRFSLRRMTEQRLGRITDVLHSPRFFRQSLTAATHEKWLSDVRLAATASAKDGVPPAPQRTFAPALIVNGSVEHSHAEDSVRRAGSVSLVGIEESGWEFLQTSDVAVPVDREVVLGYRTASEIGAKPGDEVSVWVEVPSSIPRDSLLGERDEVNIEIVLTVSAVLQEDVGASRFDLNPGQQLPYNAFLPLETLQQRLDLDEIIPDRRNPVARAAKVNAILVAHNGDTSNIEKELVTTAESLNAALKSTLTIGDMGVRLRTITERGYISGETEQMILNDSLAEGITEAAASLGLITAPTIVYLSNEISATDRGDDSERYSMYSIIGALPFDSPAPLGPLQLASGAANDSLGDDEIVLSHWLASDLNVEVGDKVQAAWHEVGSHGELPEIKRSFTVRGILDEHDVHGIDRDLTPYVKGVSEADTFSDIDQPFEMDMERLTERDNDYWDDHRAAPKAFVTLKTAENLWKSRYGRFTSIRIAPDGGSVLPEEQLQSIVKRLEFEIPRQVDPASLGLGFRPVLAEGLQAAVGANDFTVLFLGFSFFLILSAIILASLMFRLGIQRRISQVGLLTSVGWMAFRIRRLFLLEGLIVCLGGTALGAVGGVYFARLMIYGLTTWWAGAVGTQFLLIDVQPAKLLIGAAISLSLTLVVIWRALHGFNSVNLRDQLAGNAEGLETGTRTPFGAKSAVMKASIWLTLFGAVCLPLAVLADVVPTGEAFEGLSWQMVCFFLAGFCGLTYGLLLLSAVLRRRSRTDSVRGATSGIAGLAIANAARSPMRSMLTTALIASATFVIVAVGAGRRNPLSETPDFRSGNGGFSLVAESAQPVLFDLNSAEGRSRLGFKDSNSIPPDVTVYPFSVKPGADASCVNLYQTRVPTILGATDDFIDRGGFRFANTAAEEWQLLRKVIPSDGVPVFPVIGDMNTLKYSLKKNIGDQILVPNDSEPTCALQIVGMLDGSVFQGVVVMSDENLKQVDIDIAGSRYFLVETPDLESLKPTATILESVLNDYGIDAEPVSQRLAGFLAVQNTYLSTFQILGGLGLLVGTFGLAAVMMRNVFERRSEIALMRAVGFTSFRVIRLVLFENCVLLLWGMCLGTVSALLAMMPHLQSTGAQLPWQTLGITLLIVAVFGSLASVFAVRAATSVSIRYSLAAE